jgi:hypothetical protein
MITNCQKEKKRNNPIHAIMPNFRKNDIYIYIYAKKDKTGSQNPTRQTRHSWRMGRQNGEGNEMRKRERERERGNCQKEKQTTIKEGRNAMQES